MLILHKALRLQVSRVKHRVPEHLSPSLESDLCHIKSQVKSIYKVPNIVPRGPRPIYDFRITSLAVCDSVLHRCSVRLKLVNAKVIPQEGHSRITFYAVIRYAVIREWPSITLMFMMEG